MLHSQDHNDGMIIRFLQFKAALNCKCFVVTPTLANEIDMTTKYVSMPSVDKTVTLTPAVLITAANELHALSSNVTPLSHLYTHRCHCAMALLFIF